MAGFGQHRYGDRLRFRRDPHLQQLRRAAFGQRHDQRADLAERRAAALSITQDFAGTTLSDLSFQVNSLNNDGTGGGQFTGVSISSNGDVVAQYSNGATKTMGTIALASFVNPQGLIAVSGNNWLASVGSGAPVVNPPGASGVGTLESGSLGGSNVDLSTQLVNLIVAQQAYQANVRGINIDQQDVAKLLQL